MKIKIMEAKKKDLPFILKLYAVKDIDAGNVLPIKKAEQIFSNMRSYPNYKIYIAVFNSKTVGTYSLAIMDNIAHLGKSSGLVEAVVVDETMRSKGIGKQMMKHALRICKANNCYKMNLSSNLKRKRAHHFYQKLGFKRHGISFSIKP
jgi:GNAT superfamily N-acetyltransferase